MMKNLEPHLELEIETQVSLLEEMIWIIQLDPMMTLYCLMVIDWVVFGIKITNTLAVLVEIMFSLDHVHTIISV